MTRGITALAENVAALAHAPKGEDYNGPVLFEGVAGAQILAEVLGRNLALTRRPVTDGGRGGGFQPSELEGRMGARVLPDSFDVVDDPTQKEWRGRRLFGTYDVDREGVVPKPLHLVEKGVLKGFLLTRQPVRGFEGSNGRARLPGSFGANTAGISNLFVSVRRDRAGGGAEEEADRAVPGARQALRHHRAQDGFSLLGLDGRGAATARRARRERPPGQHADPGLQGVSGRARGTGARPAVPRLERALAERHSGRRRRQPPRSNSWTAPAPFALMGASAFTAEACVVAPSILIDDLELHPAEDELPKLPVVPAPEMTR